jgi:DNA (cytosine-5)-methyltransferase 1
MSPEWAVNLYAGAGGWEVAAKNLGVEVLGLEWNAAAVATAKAAGHRSQQEDVTLVGPNVHGFRLSPWFWSGRGLIASPPCQPFSTSGNGKGRAQLSDILEAVPQVAHGKKTDVALHDDRARHVLEPMRWVAEALSTEDPYQWIVLEQVPSVLPVWEAIAQQLRAVGYKVATGCNSAEQFGTPQTRRRAVLIAHREKDVHLPMPTHNTFNPRIAGKGRYATLDLLPWVSLADALGWGDDPDIAEGNWGPFVNNQSGTAFDYWAIANTPATVIQGRGLVPFRGATANRFNGSTKSRNDGFKITVAEAGILQGFPADYPWQGTLSEQYLQAGNAIPVQMAEAILKEVL